MFLKRGYRQESARKLDHDDHSNLDLIDSNDEEDAYYEEDSESTSEFDTSDLLEDELPDDYFDEEDSFSEEEDPEESEDEFWLNEDHTRSESPVSRNFIDYSGDYSEDIAKHFMVTVPPVRDGNEQYVWPWLD